MRVESMTIEVLRQGESYTNDKLALRVALDEGENWLVIEPQLRDLAVGTIEGHWRRRLEREEAARLAEIEQRRTKRNERAKEMQALHEADAVEGPCMNCSERYGLGCNGCPAEETRPAEERQRPSIPF